MRSEITPMMFTGVKVKVIARPTNSNITSRLGRIYTRPGEAQNLMNFYRYEIFAPVVTLRVCWFHLSLSSKARKVIVSIWNRFNKTDSINWYCKIVLKKKGVIKAEFSSLINITTNDVSIFKDSPVLKIPRLKDSPFHVPHSPFQNLSLGLT